MLHIICFTGKVFTYLIIVQIFTMDNNNYFCYGYEANTSLKVSIKYQDLRESEAQAIKLKM